MPSDAEQVRAALVEFGERGAFSEESYGALKRAVSGAARVSGDVIDGFVALFFERHVLDDVRRRELIAMDDVGLFRARCGTGFGKSSPELRMCTTRGTRCRRTLVETRSPASWAQGTRIRRRLRQKRLLVARGRASRRGVLGELGTAADRT